MTVTDDTAEWVEDPDGAAADEADDEQDDEQPKKPGVRARLKAAEEERDDLRAALDWTRQAIFIDACNAAGVESELMTAAGLRAEDFLDENSGVDGEALAAAVEAKRSELGVPRRPRPLAQAGRGPGDAPQQKPATFGDVFKAHVEANRL